MVHVICMNEDCKTIIHLDDMTHWNYKGKIKCPRCGDIFEIEIKEGILIKITHSHTHDR